MSDVAAFRESIAKALGDIATTYGQSGDLRASRLCAAQVDAVLSLYGLGEVVEAALALQAMDPWKDDASITCQALLTRLGETATAFARRVRAG